ncbi:conserved hypothetical protein [Ricinus communis]|uniref:Uncharacterized protein n=1 Tax=Ricinus communis TaxID=3988 RepID=B9T9S6_RICCO|nr:conserved hypothetical protein [Ricinus communis]
MKSDFEVKLYYGSSLMAAPITEISFEKATLDGFHKLFQFIQGANLNWARIPMTNPVVTSIVPGDGPFQSLYCWEDILRSPWANTTSIESKSTYSIAHYDAPFHLIGHVNEI